jgi:hypothetical protein
MLLLLVVVVQLLLLLLLPLGALWEHFPCMKLLLPVLHRITAAATKMRGQWDVLGLLKPPQKAQLCTGISVQVSGVHHSNGRHDQVVEDPLSQASTTIFTPATWRSL